MYVGSSEVYPIIMGQGYEVWAEKTGKLEPQQETDVMIRGQLLEPAILNFAAMSLGPIITEPSELEFIANDLHLIDHPDGIVDNTGYPVETKSQGAYAKEVWGDEHTDAVPDRAIVQAHVHMLCMGATFCHVPAYLAFREFQMFGVGMSDRIVQVIKDHVGHFWNEHVIKDIPPEDNLPSMDVLKRIRRIPETVADISDISLGKWLGLKEASKEAVKKEKAAYAEIVTQLGQAEAGQTSDGQMVTFFEQKTGGLLTKKLREEHPDIAARYANPGRHRVLRLKK
jgi:predicted phage-related endonuclease